LDHSFEKIISVENLLLAWEEFLKGKRKKIDVQQFSLKLMDNILALRRELLQKSYKHGRYKKFHICDPKQREIHKATVRDRLLHHAVYRILYPVYDKTFFADSFSCRLEKGTHKAMARFMKFFYKVSKNNTRTCWVLKCDIEKFFDSVDHQVLLKILKQKISDENTLWLLEEIILSFSKKTIQSKLFDLQTANRERERERVKCPSGTESRSEI
jgi:retron-type reverse transcriptase